MAHEQTVKLTNGKSGSYYTPVSEGPIKDEKMRQARKKYGRVNVSEYASLTAKRGPRKAARRKRVAAK